MDFKTVTSNLITALQREHVSYALIGGFAVSLWGYQRATVDIDFLVNNNDMEKVRQIVEGMGYRCIHASENVTQFLSNDKRQGKLDFLHAFRPASLQMLERAKLKTIFDSEQTIPVILPEDLIGLKVHTMSDFQTEDTLLVGTDAESLTQDCRQLRHYSRTDLPSADEVIAFLDGYNSFINHATAPFTPMRDIIMLL